MDQELKQRLIGAAVITALAVIFVPMLFDDPVDETGKEINALTIPELSAKAQDVEIMPLPEKVEDVVTDEPSVLDEDVADAADVEAPRPRVHLSDRNPHVPAKQLPAHDMSEPDIHADPDEGIAEAEDVSPVIKPAPLAVKAPAAKQLKPDTKSPEPTPAANQSGTRWYLNAGSFSKKANALSRQESLKQQGFAASIKEVATEKGTVYKVRIGPMLDKAKAQAVKNRLTQINVNSFVASDE